MLIFGSAHNSNFSSYQTDRATKRSEEFIDMRKLLEIMIVNDNCICAVDESIEKYDAFGKVFKSKDFVDIGLKRSRMVRNDYHGCGWMSFES